MVRLRLQRLWEYLNATYWFVPSVMAALAVGLAALTLWIDGHANLSKPIKKLVWNGGAEAAREIMAIIAGSMITITGVVFSIVIVALTLASQQFGPRLLYNFMRDTLNQIVLGTFVSTFLYCLVILRTVRQDANEFVPNLSVSVGVLLAFVSVGILIVFIHHIAMSIRAENVISLVSRDLQHAINSLLPREDGPDDQAAGRLPSRDDAVVVRFNTSGYIQTIDHLGITDLACKHDVLVDLPYRPGRFVFNGNVMAYVHGPKADTDELAEALCDAVVVGGYRTPTQDVEFAIHQLVEIAVRALSPGVNDPFTAVACVNQLGDAVISVARHRPAPTCHYDGTGKLRLVTGTVDFDGAVDSAFNLVRQAAANSPSVLIRMLEVIRDIAPQMQTARQRGALLTHVQKLECVGRTFTEAHDVADFRERVEAATAALNDPKSR